MFKKIVPVLMLVFVAACANMQGDHAIHRCHCEKQCPCVQKGECVCKEHCTHCSEEDGICVMCHHEGAASTPETKPCPVCLEKEQG